MLKDLVAAPVLPTVAQDEELAVELMESMEGAGLVDFDFGWWLGVMLELGTKGLGVGCTTGRVRVGGAGSGAMPGMVGREAGKLSLRKTLVILIILKPSSR